MSKNCRSSPAALTSTSRLTARNLRPIQPPRGFFHQLGAGREIPVGIAHAGVAEVSGEHWELLLDVLAFAIPVEQCPDGEAMTEVVNAWPGMIAWAPQPDPPGQSPEDAMDVLVQQAASLFGNEEGRAAA